MADKQYIVVTPLKEGNDKKGQPSIIPPGKPVTLSEEEAQPLLDIGAIRAPDIIEEAPAVKK